MMNVIKTAKALRRWRKTVDSQKSVGFVPTMGALHAGHLSLVKKSLRQNDISVVSIFINPTQFGPKEDLQKYPRTLRQDLLFLKELGVDVVFAPHSAQEIYPDVAGEVQIKAPQQLSSILEGRFRPGHFDGVCQVVLKLFHLVEPERAYFGEKDYQQLAVIKKMTADLFLPVKIVGCPTRREKSGLAMSSRNTYLTEQQKQEAAGLSSVLRSAPSVAKAKSQLRASGFDVEYLECWNSTLTQKLKGPKGRWLVAAKFHGVRLIDNVWRR